MTEMNPVSRFFVNLSARRRSRRRFGWIARYVPVPTSAQCLELGCGNAVFAAEFVVQFHPAAYRATDVDPDQLSAAHRLLDRRFPSGVPPELHLERASMLELPYPDATLDVVLAFVTLHHAAEDHHDFPAVQKALAEVNRVLRPGGLFVYEEFLHRDAIRAWLGVHGYRVDQSERRFRLERVAARKPVPAVGH